MVVTVKRATLWRSEVGNKPGELARALEPIARAGSDLQVVMAYRYPGNDTRAAIEVYPITGGRAAAAARAGGLTASVHTDAARRRRQQARPGIRDRQSLGPTRESTSVFK